MKTALVFDPYLDTLGGGERYTLTVAKVLAANGYKVSLAWNNKDILKAATKRFGLSFQDIGLDKNAFNLLNASGQFLNKIKATQKYNLIFFLSDGSIPFLFGKKNLVHFQVPFKQISNFKKLNCLKFKLINKFVYNSNFTQNVLEKSLPKKGLVLYPPIDTASLKPAKKKENIILAVGRFNSPSHSKRQDILIEAFKALYKETNGSYQLVLAGGLIGDNAPLKKLESQAKGLPVEFVVNPSFKELSQLYSKSKIFWHAAGFGVDEQQNPDKVEHFGMTTVEAMSAGCVPVVCNKGGQKEIITTGTGFLWNTISDLVGQTLLIIKDPQILKETSKKALKRSAYFGLKTFKSSLRKLI